LAETSVACSSWQERRFYAGFKRKITFSGSYGGGAAQMTAFLSQLLQMGAFEKISGLLLGTFYEDGGGQRNAGYDGVNLRCDEEL
jgi:muramoyltetrapeptide carboxypeptidase LdcA involved in peptidoglycan recycling